MAGSLSLLKGAQTAPVEEETPAEETAPEAETTATEEASTEAEGGTEESEQVDPDKLSSKEIDALVAKYEIETPDEWKKWKVQQKRDWLKEQFSGDGGEAEGEGEADQEAEVEAEAPAPDPTPEPTKAITTTKPAAKGKDKAPAKSNVKSGEVQAAGDDVLADIIHDIETVGEKEARKLVGTLAEQSDVTYFRIGGLLSVIRANGWYTPYASFREFVEQEHGIEYRKVTYWIGIYQALAESKIPWNKVKSLPWGKLKEIATILTLDNVDEWVATASKNTVLVLHDMVDKFKKGVKQIGGEGTPAVTTKTFKVNADQRDNIESALAKAKSEANTEYDTVALEAICMDYLAAPTLVQKMQELGLEEAAGLLEKAFPGIQLAITTP